MGLDASILAEWEAEIAAGAYGNIDGLLIIRWGIREDAERHHPGMFPDRGRRWTENTAI